MSISKVSDMARCLMSKMRWTPVVDVASAASPQTVSVGCEMTPSFRNARTAAMASSCQCERFLPRGVGCNPFGHGHFDVALQMF